jgi:hypothetical protein
VRQGFSWTQLSVEGVRTGAVRDLFGVGKCHELAGFRGQLVRAWAWYRVAVRWVNGSAVGADLLPVGAVGWWLVVPLLNQCLALALDLDRRGSSNRRPFPYRLSTGLTSYPQGEGVGLTKSGAG